VFPYQFHHYIVHQNRAISWLFVTFELGHTATDWLAHMRNTPVRFTSVAAWADRLVEAYASRGKAGNRRRAEIVLLTGLILNELSRVCHPGLPPKAPRPAAATALAQRVNSFVYANMGSRLRIRDIALHCNLSDGRLRALYRAAMGLSLGAYLRRIRIRRGMDLMRSADMKLSRVATECGYGSLVAFSYAFKREAGMTPGAFRRQRPGE